MTTTMNILQMTVGFYPATAWGGPVKVVYQNGKSLVNRGHQVTVCCTNLLDKRHKIQHGTFERQVDGMRVIYFDAWHLTRWPGTLGPVWLPDMPAWLRQEIASFDIVHINGYRTLMMLPAIRIAHQAHVPIVLQPHGTMPILMNSLLAKRVYDRLMGWQELKYVSTLIALQESERQQAIAIGIPEDRIEIIPNGVDLEEQLPAPGGFRQRFGIAVDKPLILFLGRINKKKGTDMLVHAFAKLRNLDAQLVIAGPDDGQLQEVQGLILQYDLEKRVIFPGLLSDSEALVAFQDADVFVLPCRFDTYPMTIIESCLAGTPMVITDGCEISHLVQDRVAEVVPFDADAFANAIDRLLTDSDLYERYRANCPFVLKDTFSLSTVVDQLEKVYKLLVDGNKNRYVATD